MSGKILDVNIKVAGLVVSAVVGGALLTGGALAQTGSVLGELTTDGTVLIERGSASERAASRDAVFDGDKVVTSGKNSGATIEFVEGGDLTVFGDSAASVAGGQLVFSSGGGCFSGLSSPVDILAADGTVVASGVTSGAVFDGVFHASCAQALAALDAAGGGLSPLARTVLVATGIVIGVEILDDDDDPVHGS